MQMTKSNIGYKGNVIISNLVGNKKCTFSNHNAALDYLKKSFCKYLTGNINNNGYDIPEYLDLEKYIDNEWTSILYQKSPLTGQVFSYDSTEENWIATFTSTIRYGNMTVHESSEEDDNTDTYRLVLLTGYDTQADSITGEPVGYHKLAEMRVTPKVISQISPGVQTIVEWQMQLVDYVEN